MTVADLVEVGRLYRDLASPDVGPLPDDLAKLIEALSNVPAPPPDPSKPDE